MRNKFSTGFLWVTKTTILAIAVLVAGMQITLADISTLFTTQQERQIIDRNRYKNESAKQAQPEEKKPVVNPVNELVREEINKSYTISGISVSSDGAHAVWVNGQVYEDGELVDDQNRLKVMVGNDIKVRITAPDGKHYFATSGETVEFSYLEAVDS